jgi:hypothetical protein
MKNTFIKLAVVSSALWAQAVFADWNLKADESSLHFISIKQNMIAETNRFEQLEGSITETGDFQFSINLGGLETNIPIRNERMNEFLFESAKFPLAAGKGKVDMAQVSKLAVGELMSMTVPVTIELHGASVKKDVMLQVARLSSQKLWAVTEVPFIINAAEFNLTDGIEKLRELAGLPGITQAVPVSVSLVFVKAGKESK